MGLPGVTGPVGEPGMQGAPGIPVCFPVPELKSNNNLCLFLGSSWCAGRPGDARKDSMLLFAILHLFNVL